jgi:hypothetical protein
MTNTDSGATLTVKAGPHDRRDCPVSVLWPAGRSLPASVELLDDATGRRISAQRGAAEGGGSLLSWIEPHLPAGASRTYRVVEGVATTEGVALVDAEGGLLDVRAGDQLITSYHYKQGLARPFLHPLIGPAERPVTRHVDLAQRQTPEFDHIHHRSVWVAHGDVNGTDNWSEERGHGRTAHRAFVLREAGPVYARFAAEGQWLTASGQPLLDELRRITVYRRLSDERLLLDLDVTLTAAHGPVRFGDTKEGGLLSVRVASTMTGARGGLIENSYGALTETEAWGRPAQWCDYSGPAGESDPAVVGIAVLDHPLNPRHPTHWHVRDYGLMTANPFGLATFYSDPSRDGSLQLPAGNALTFRYRMVIHPGNAAQGAVRAAYLDYAYPPVEAR